jgi:nonsense-mediated mRNA decay protein 3
MGYMLTGTNLNDPNYEALEASNVYSSTIPDVMLVKKFYARKKKSKNNRNWKLKRMAREEGEMLPKKSDQEKMDRDYEMFLRDVEEDEELRQTMALYRQQKKQRDMEEMSMAETSDGEDETPHIDMNELIDDFDELDVHDK